MCFLCCKLHQNLNNTHKQLCPCLNAICLVAGKSVSIILGFSFFFLVNWISCPPSPQPGRGREKDDGPWKHQIATLWKWWKEEGGARRKAATQRSEGRVWVHVRARRWLPDIVTHCPRFRLPNTCCGPPLTLWASSMKATSWLINGISSSSHVLCAACNFKYNPWSKHVINEGQDMQAAQCNRHL